MWITAWSQQLLSNPDVPDVFRAEQIYSRADGEHRVVQTAADNSVVSLSVVNSFHPEQGSDFSTSLMFKFTFSTSSVFSVWFPNFTFLTLPAFQSCEWDLKRVRTFSCRDRWKNSSENKPLHLKLMKKYNRVQTWKLAHLQDNSATQKHNKTFKSDSSITTSCH